MMKKAWMGIFVCMVFGVVGMFGCGGSASDDDDSEGEDTDSTTGDDTGTDADGDGDTDSDTSGDAGPDGSSDTDVDTDTDMDVDTDTDTDTDADTDTDTDADTDTDTNPGLTVNIVQPDDNATFFSATTIDFVCRARLTDGSLPESPSFTWDIQPADLTLFGARVSTQVPNGEQTVVCQVTDVSSGLTNSDQIAITVGDVTVRIIEPEDGMRYPETAPGSGQSEVLDFSAVGQSSTGGGGGSYTWQLGTITTLMGRNVQTAMPIGAHTITVTYEDSEGSQATASIGIEVLTTDEWDECQNAEEVCNNKDDNCNGEVDEGQISCGVGACYREVDRCVGGEDNICVPDDPTPERCNGRDDDCDGATDDHDGDVNSLCNNPGEVCQDGDCEDFEIADECTTCPCDQCDNDWNWDLCCTFSGVGSGVICLDQNADDPCPEP